MEMPIRKNCRYAVACLTSMGVRITPEGHRAAHSSDRFFMQATSAETNALNVAASLGRECLALTKFVEGSPVAAFIKSKLRERNIAYEGRDVPPGGAWGLRHQFNIADSGFGLRAPRVWNDRAGEVGRTLSAEEFDLERIFGREGVGILHLSGLIASLSPEATACCLALAEAAKANGTLVSFDLNYRPSFWQGREAELSAAFHTLASEADVLIGSRSSFRLCLGVGGDDGGAADSVEALLGEVQRRYPSARVCAATLRQELSVGEHLWGAALLFGGRYYEEPSRSIPVLDRIGGGDAFAGGLLYGILSGWEPEQWLQFGWGCGALACSGLTDYAEIADERQVWDIYRGNARVQR